MNGRSHAYTLVANDEHDKRQWLDAIRSVLPEGNERCDVKKSPDKHAVKRSQSSLSDHIVPYSLKLHSVDRELYQDLEKKSCSNNPECQVEENNEEVSVTAYMEKSPGVVTNFPSATCTSRGIADGKEDLVKRQQQIINDKV